MSRSVNVYFFNAGEGDSIVIEIIQEDSKYIVIDSNLITIDSKKINPAYEFLMKNKASSISALIISHLHQDHYNGIELLIRDFDVEKIIIPPFLSTKSNIFNKIVDSYRKEIDQITKRCSDDDILQYCKSLAYLIHYISNNDHKVEEASGKESILRLKGVNWIEFIVYLPLKKIKGVLHQLIINHEYSLNNFPSMNDSSIVICLNCFGKRILLTGDSSISQWSEHKRQMARDGVENLDINFLKVPHHGSKYDNKEELYKYLFNFEKNQEKTIFISANGTIHPDKEMFNLIKKFKLIPYCTNMSRFCLPPNVIPYKSMRDVPPPMRTFLINYAEKQQVECQGDVTLSLTDSETNITNSSGMPCVYRI